MMKLFYCSAMLLKLVCSSFFCFGCSVVSSVLFELSFCSTFPLKLLYFSVFQLEAFGFIAGVILLFSYSVSGIRLFSNCSHVVYCPGILNELFYWSDVLILFSFCLNSFNVVLLCWSCSAVQFCWSCFFILIDLFYWFAFIQEQFFYSDGRVLQFCYPAEVVLLLYFFWEPFGFSAGVVLLFFYSFCWCCSTVFPFCWSCFTVLLLF